MPRNDIAEKICRELSDPKVLAVFAEKSARNSNIVFSKGMLEEIENYSISYCRHEAEEHDHRIDVTVVLPRLQLLLKISIWTSVREGIVEVKRWREDVSIP